jgi:prepilin-type N-terminal cleavage/methylation domain-containing protein
MTGLMSPSRARGFTLIELIAVIVVLAVLSVVAVDQYNDLRRDARIGAVAGYRAAIHSAAAMGQSAFIAAGGDVTLADQSIVINGQTVFFNFGFPRGTADGIGRLVSMSYIATGVPGFCGTGCIVWAVADNISGWCNAHYLHPFAPGQSYETRINYATC